MLMGVPSGNWKDKKFRMKKYKIIFSDRALLDIEETVAYYNEQKAGLGKRFANEVHKTLNSIKKNPFYAAVRYEDIRCAVVSVFPYLIHYEIEIAMNSVRIVSVFNTFRKELW